MDPINKFETPGLFVNVSDEFSRTVTLHKNINQEVIMTTRDKLELVLIKTKEGIAAQRDWWTPAGLLISFITTLCTAEFKPSLGINKDTWEAIFIVLSILSLIWLVICLFRLIKSSSPADPKKIIELIKLNQQETSQSS